MCIHIYIYIYLYLSLSLSIYIYSTHLLSRRAGGRLCACLLLCFFVSLRVERGVILQIGQPGLCAVQHFGGDAQSEGRVDQLAQHRAKEDGEQDGVRG